MDITSGAMNTLLPKLAALAVGEYKLQKGVKGEIEELEKELNGMNLALRKVAKVPVDQLDEQVKDWARDVRELSYDIEDVVDTFMLRTKAHGHTELFGLMGLIGKASNLYKRAKTNHKIHNIVKDIMDEVKKVAELRDRYKVDQVAASLRTVTVDPRLEGLYRKATELVGIDEPKNELVKKLMDENSSSLQRPKALSIVGFGGLGKTTLANALFQDLKGKFDCHVFVSVSLNPDLKRIFKNILLQLDETKYGNIDEAWEMKQLIDKIIDIVKNRRCLCVIDDLWNESAWDVIKLALQDGNNGSKIIITTRNKDVARHVDGAVYEIKPLSNDDSRKLLKRRIFDIEDECPPSLREISENILKKCGGVPLVIITTASLLASKSRDSMEWEKVNNSIGSGLGKSPDLEKMRKILSLSYNDLPFDLKTCLLSLSKYPEDEMIRKDVLILSWIAEGFIAKETQPPGRSLQEIGESYFSKLVNRSLIQPVCANRFHFLEQDGEVHYFRVHDMVLELINQLSVEEGFVTTLLSDGQQESTHTSVVQKRKIRRLSLHSRNKTYASPEAREQFSKLRSLTVFGNIKLIPALSSLHILRVLQLEDCTGLDTNQLNGLGELRHLRFLRLQKVTELPESIGKLESLETLDIRGTGPSVILLPVSFGKLGKLVRLLADTVELPDSLTMGNMKSLQELVGVRLTLHAVTEICKLSDLKVLILDIGEESKYSTGAWNEWILMCLQMCPSLQVLVLKFPYLYYSLDFMAQVPSGLQRFLSNGFFMKAFPRWINPSLTCLTVLWIILDNVRVLPENLEKIAELPSLRFLSLYSKREPYMQEILIVPNGVSAFPCLTDLQFESDYIMFLKFDYGAMRKLQRLRLQFDAQYTNQRFASNNFGYGLENLPSLHHVIVRLLYECPEAEDAIRKAINNNSNHPTLDIAQY